MIIGVSNNNGRSPTQGLFLNERGYLVTSIRMSQLNYGSSQYV